MAQSSISPRVKFGLLGGAVIVGLIAIANMDTPKPQSVKPDPTDSGSVPAPDVAPSPQERHKTTETIKWMSSLPDGMREAKQSHKLLMVDVFTDWCEYCKLMDATTYRDSEVVEEAKKFVTVKVNVTNDHTLEMKYRITGFPTVLWLDSDGKMISSSPGYSPDPGDFVAMMHDAQSKYADQSGA